MTYYGSLGPYRDTYDIESEHLEKDISYKIENLVASVRLNIEIDLLDLYSKLSDMGKLKYKPKRFPGLVYTPRRRPRYTSLIFNSGRVVLTGNKSVQGAESAFKSMIKLLNKVGYFPVNPEIVVTNIVAAYEFSDTDGIVDLEGIYDGSPYAGCSVMYEPDMFPGAICRLNDPRSVVLVFSSGKGVCLGAKKEEDVLKSLRKIRKMFDI